MQQTKQAKRLALSCCNTLELDKINEMRMLPVRAQESTLNHTTTSWLAAAFSPRSLAWSLACQLSVYLLNVPKLCWRKRCLFGMARGSWYCTCSIGLVSIESPLLIRLTMLKRPPVARRSDAHAQYPKTTLVLCIDGSLLPACWPISPKQCVGVV